MLSEVKALLASDQLVVKSIQKIRDRSGKLKGSAFMLSSTALAACGGAGGGGISPPPPPPPTNVFTLANGNEFTGTDQGETLSQADTDVPLIVDGLGGNDTITTGSGNDTIDGGSGNDTITSNAGADTIVGGSGNDTINAGDGNDMIRGGIGADTINGGDGNDIIVVVGTTAADQYSDSSITNPAGSGTDLSSLIALANLNNQSTSEAVSGEVIDGGAGTNTLYVYGTVDFTDVTLTNVTQVVVNSDVTFSDEQLGAGKITKITGDGGSTIRIEASDNAGVTVDFSTLDLTNVNRIDVGANVTVTVGSGTDLKNAGVSVVSGEGALQLTSPGAANDMAGIALEDAMTVKDDAGATVEHADTGATVVTPTQVAQSESSTNAAPTDIMIDNLSLKENYRGEIVGNISSNDIDENDAHTYSINDDRFEVVNGQLKLKSGVILDFEEEPSITLQITAKDLGGNAFTKNFNLSIEDTAEALEGSLILGNDLGSIFGSSLSYGDFNNDGYGDIIAGDFRYNGYEGEAYIIFGNKDGLPDLLRVADLNGINGFVFNGDPTGNNLGRSVSFLGDINGDGFDDVITGQGELNSKGLYDTGAVYIIYGHSGNNNLNLTSNELDGTNGFVIYGPEEFEDLGHTVSGAGDINNDGLDDFIIEGSGSGNFYVVFGNKSGFGASFDLSTLDGTSGFVIEGAIGLGRSTPVISDAGDINGDGFDDIIIGSTHANNDGVLQSGAAYVLYGKETGFDSVINLDNLDGINGFKIYNNQEWEKLGYSVSAAGDVNGDGVDDFVIGSIGGDKSYVVFGSKGGFGPSFNLANLDGNNGFSISGIYKGRQSYPILGEGVSIISSAGDINGDGFDDIIIGAPNSRTENAHDPSGKAYVIFGKSTAFNSVLDVSELNGTNGFEINGVSGWDSLGSFVSRGGDINGDGIDDFLIGSRGGQNNIKIYSPITYVIYGHKGAWEASYNIDQVVTQRSTLDTVQSLNGEPPISVNIDENTTDVMTIISNLTGTKTYTLFGDDASKFTVDSEGFITFKSGMDYDNPNDLGGDNTFNFYIEASNEDGQSEVHEVEVNLQNVNEAPTLTSFLYTQPLYENTTAVATFIPLDDAEDVLTYSIEGEDGELFEVSSDGVISFKIAPDYENPTDTDKDNTYKYTLVLTDQAGLSNYWERSAYVISVNEHTPVVTAPASVSMNENSSEVLTAGYVDIDLYDTRTYSLSGADAALFSIDVDGAVSFINAPNYENPIDVGQDNIYNFDVVVTDSADHTGTTSVVVTIDDISFGNGDVNNPAETLSLVTPTALPNTVTGEAPIIDGNTYTINANETFYKTTSIVTADPSEVSIINNGVMWGEGIEATLYLNKLQFLNNIGEIINNGGGNAILVSSMDNYYDNFGDPAFSNSGLIYATAATDVTSVYLHSAHNGILNSGTIQAKSTGGNAIGLHIYYYKSLIVNSGDIFVEGYNGAIGLRIDQFYSSSGTRFIENNGKIIVQTTGGSDISIAIQYVEESSDLTIFNNNGFIQGRWAFKSTGAYAGNEVINNDGEIWGDFELRLGSDEINNDGLIVGDIFFYDEDDNFNGSNGIYQGTIEAGSGNDTISTGAGDAIINGGTGDDTITSGAGNDILMFDDGFGNDTVTDFEDGADLINFSGHSTVSQFSDLAITVVDGDTVINDGNGNTITLEGITSGIDANDFIF